MKEKIQTNAAPAAIGPYSQAIKYGDTIYTSGAIPLDEKGEIADDIASQTRQALTNVKAVLAAAGATMNDVVKVTCYITDMDKFAVVNEVYGEFFEEPYPARSCVEVSRLPKDVGVEIDTLAIIS